MAESYSSKPVLLLDQILTVKNYHFLLKYSLPYLCNSQSLFMSGTFCDECDYDDVKSDQDTNSNGRWCNKDSCQFTFVV